MLAVHYARTTMKNVQKCETHNVKDIFVIFALFVKKFFHILHFVTNLLTVLFWQNVKGIFRVVSEFRQWVYTMREWRDEIPDNSFLTRWNILAKSKLIQLFYQVWTFRTQPAKYDVTVDLIWNDMEI